MRILLSTPHSIKEDKVIQIGTMEATNCHKIQVTEEGFSIKSKFVKVKWSHYKDDPKAQPIFNSLNIHHSIYAMERFRDESCVKGNI